MQEGEITVLRDMFIFLTGVYISFIYPRRGGTCNKCQGQGLWYSPIHLVGNTSTIFPLRGKQLFVRGRPLTPRMEQ
jgi:hypothetical protein